MTYSVYQHWDPLQTCVVGKTYPPEFYHWIKDSATRTKFEKLAEETEDDYQRLINLLKDKFSVEVLRPQLPSDLDSLFVNDKWVMPPTAPRDYFITIGNQLWVPRVPNGSHAWNVFYRQHKHSSWQDFTRPEHFYAAYPEYANEMRQKFLDFQDRDQNHLNEKLKFYANIFSQVTNSGAEIVYTDHDFINGCFVSRIGKDLFFATQTFHENKQQLLDSVTDLFPSYRNHIVDSGGHGDAVYCPVAPGLIISLRDIPTYSDTFPGWEVVYLPDSNYAYTEKFKQSMIKTKGRWFIPGFDRDANLINMVNHYFDEWVGQVSETVFDVNILIVDPKNIIVSTHNDAVESACARHGIEVHISPFKHKYFWDCGIHCITNDLNRSGLIQQVLD
jgi:hypothetical protein